MSTTLQLRVGYGQRDKGVLARGLRRTFEHRRRIVEAVAGIDLTITQGEVFGLLGPNGAGKTTTMRMLATLLPPTGGSARVAGRDLRTDPAGIRQRIGYVGQRSGAIANRTPQAEIVLQGRLYRMSAGEARRRAAELLDSFDLRSCAERAVRTLSGGQRRRLDVALGLVHRPRVLFLDEPTVGLDPEGRARLWEEIRRLGREGTTILFTTHYMEEADALCDRVAIVDHGRVLAEGTPDHLKRQTEGDVVSLVADGDTASLVDALETEAFVRSVVWHRDALRIRVDDGEASIPRILQLMDRRCLQLRGVSISRPSLDDVFLQRRHLLSPSAARMPGEA